MATSAFIDSSEKRQLPDIMRAFSSDCRTRVRHNSPRYKQKSNLLLVISYVIPSLKRTRTKQISMKIGQAEDKKQVEILAVGQAGRDIIYSGSSPEVAKRTYNFPSAVPQLRK